MDRYRLLLVDDDLMQLKVLAHQLSGGSLGDRLLVSVASTAEEAQKLLAEFPFDGVVTDLNLPGMSGRELLSEIKTNRKDTDVLVLTAATDARTAVECLKDGAEDYFTKPVSTEELVHRLERLVGLRDLRREGSIRPGWQIRLPSPGMQEVRQALERIRGSDFPVLLLGESGVGKEIIANALQRMSGRASGPFIKVNCAGLVSSLLESEMFGHEKGAFTGAVGSKPGKFELAHGGTLFLDEIGDLEPGLQAKLLRVVQDGTYERVGGVRTLKADVRLLAATNQNLTEAVAAGKFREDLYYRLNVIQVRIPPLRERREDILVLATRFLAAFSVKYNKPMEGFSRDAAEALEAYRWPGNVRELENAVARAFTMATGTRAVLEDLPTEVRQGGTRAAAANPVVSLAVTNLQEFLSWHERQHLVAVIGVADGNRSLAAQRLGISRRQLYNKLHQYGLITS
ncbi:MAG: sigma-54 dependent transcriptional regulator [Spirochaetales bacterium]